VATSSVDEPERDFDNRFTPEAVDYR